jgi:hypothetical protein
MPKPMSCRSVDHIMARRQVLGGLIGMGTGATLIGGVGCSALAKDLRQKRKQMLIIFLDGAVSQLESWDPKPGTDTGGPFLAIPTSVPGTHVCELLPHTSQQMQHLAVIRSINTHENNHARGKYLMTRGRRKEPTTDYPDLGAVTGKLLGPKNAQLPRFVHLESGKEASGSPTPSGKDAAYLGQQYGSLVIGDCQSPENTLRFQGLGVEGDRARRDFRRLLDQRFVGRGNAATQAYTFSFEQALQLMQQRSVFDVNRETAKDQASYGNGGFGRNCLLARRLLERGIPCVKVVHGDYDTHNENFNHHLEQLGEFDRPFATLIADLAERGMLEHTLVVVMSEFGRTPKINHKFGRDHWSAAWSLVLAGCGIQKPALFGKTNKNGTEVSDKEVDHRRLFHTFLRATGVDTSRNFKIDGRPIPVADPAASAIEEILS